MTLMKSVLLGSAASLMVVASAQAADLPTKKGAPAAEYVKVCKVGDIAGWIVPGTDTCLKISGFVTARYAVGATHERRIRAGGAGLTKYVAQRSVDAVRHLDARPHQRRRGVEHRLRPVGRPYGHGRRVRRRLHRRL